MANREYAVFTKSKCEHVQQVVTCIQTPQERSKHIRITFDSCLLLRLCTAVAELMCLWGISS
jgi:hypothetical protein